MDVNQIFFVGHNKYGQAGIGQQQHNKKISQPKQIVFKTFVKQISCGNHHSALLTIDGLIYTMGSNIHGTLGLGSNGSINYAFKPTLIKQLKDVDQIYSGKYHMCATKQGQIYSWGKGIDGQLGHGNMKNLFTPTKILVLGNDVESVSCGSNHTLVLINNKNFDYNGYSFGNGIYGQLGQGSNKSSNYPVNIKLSNIQTICAGQNHSLFLKNHQVYGCGDNSQFQLGSFQDQLRSRKYILQPLKLELEFNSQINLISSGNLSAALTSDNKIYAWGGKYKIWPARQIQDIQALNIKVASQKLYILNQKNQIISFEFNSSINFNSQQQVIISDQNILDFDAGQNHLLAIGDIIAQVQIKQQQSILSIWKGQQLQESKQRFSKKHILSQQNQYFLNQQQKSEANIKSKDFFITKHLKSGSSEDQEVSQSKASKQYYSFQSNQLPESNLNQTVNKFSEALSSSIQIQQKNKLEIQDSWAKKPFQDITKIKTQQYIQNFQKDKGPKSQNRQIQIFLKDVQIINYAQTKLQRLLGSMQQKTIHLKKSYTVQQESNIRKSSKSQVREQIIQQDNKLQKNNMIKTPSSYIKKQPQNFILESRNRIQCNSFQADQNINYEEKVLNADLFLYEQNKQNILIQRNITQYKHLKQFNIQPDNRKIKKNILQIQDLPLQIFKQKSQILQDKRSLNNNIESIFQHLLRKHHKQNINKKQVNSYNNGQDEYENYIQKSPKLSHSCISQKIMQKQSYRIEKSDVNQTKREKSWKALQNTRLSQTSNQNYPIKLHPNQRKLSSSKISTHSNVSIKTNTRKNHDFLQISRSNRQLRYELRDRDLKISKLQEQLSKKQMLIESLYNKIQKIQRYKNIKQSCQQYEKEN